MRIFLTETKENVTASCLPYAEMNLEKQVLVESIGFLLNDVKMSEDTLVSKDSQWSVEESFICAQKNEPRLKKL